ncbi:hypothetical protein [Salininema proteolyticum]|uniref:Minor tail protein n=1 Tax=Salininema proteolyticum TaxID=1607685 RepID=A0ABV8TTR5_9ACTN
MAEDFVVELRYNGTWNDITADVRDADPIVTTRGRRDWANHADPATCTLRLNNGASAAATGQFGRYSPRNPLSDLYGLIGRNTPLRVRSIPRASHLYASGGTDPWAYATTPDHSTLDITSDLDVRLDIDPDSWRPTKSRGLARKYVTTDDHRSWAVELENGGNLWLAWSPDGTLGSRLIARSTVSLPVSQNRLAVRATLDVDDGTGGWTVRFWTAPTIDGAWTQLGDPVSESGTTAVHASTAPVEVGRIGPLGVEVAPFVGRVYAFQLYDGIDGTLVANADFRDLDADAESFTDSSGREWDIEGHAYIRDDATRFVGEVASWPPRWDLSGADQRVSVTAAGITRRLQQGAKPLKSSLFRDLSIRDDVVAYWPLEEPSGATRFTSGRPGSSSYLIPRDLPEIEFAADDSLNASAALPTIGASTILGDVPPYTGATDQRFFCYMRIPTDGFDSDRLIFRLATTGSAALWDIYSTIGDGIRVIAFDEDGNELENKVVTSDLYGRPNFISLLLLQNGADVDWQFAWFPIDDPSALTMSGTISGATYGRFSKIFVGSTNDVEGTTFGHPTILNDNVDLIWDTIKNSGQAWEGETGTTRLQRLASDEDLPLVRVIGDSDAVETMGPQRIVALMDLFREAATADMGILTDSPDALGIQYRTRKSLYNQVPKVVIDYSTGVIADPFSPVEDDQATRNDITVNRVGGSSHTARKESGPLSIAAPPDGVGVYDHSEDIVIDSDTRLPAQAGWRLHLGTIDAARWPTVSFNLRNPRIAGTLADDLLALHEGDIIRITNLPPQVPPGPVDLFVEAITETRSAATHLIDFTCSPGEAWTVMELDHDTTGRIDTAGSQLATGADSTTTSLVIATDSGNQPWIEIGRGLLLPGADGSYASTPDTASLDITGDIDLRVEATRESWAAPDTEEVMASKYRDSTSDRSWRFSFDSSGFLHFRWSTDGTSGALETRSSDAVPVPDLQARRIALRVTLDVSTGDVTFWTASTIDGSWTQLGTTQTGSATSIYASAADLEAGARDDGTQTPWHGTIHALQVRNGIAGTLVADTNFAEQDTATNTFTDDTGLPWTAHGDASIGPEDTFDITIGGETMLVEGITGATSPQTFRVVRARNGIEKSQTAGTSVFLASPHVIAL